MLGGHRRAAVKAYVELLARGQELDSEDAKSVGQVVKGDEEFALRRFQDSGEIHPRLRGLSESRVVNTVAKALDLGAEDLRGPARHRNLSHGRAIAAHLGKRLGGISLARTARYFHRDESTIVREVGLLEQRLQGDKQARRALAAIVKQLRVSK